VAKLADLEFLVAEATEAHGRLDIMCNIAGTMSESTISS